MTNRNPARRMNNRRVCLLYFGKQRRAGKQDEHWQQAEMQLHISQALNDALESEAPTQ